MQHVWAMPGPSIYLHWSSIYITKSASSENNICGALFLNKSHIYYWRWLMCSSTVYYYWWGLYICIFLQTYINFFTRSKDENVRHLQCEFRMTHCFYTHHCALHARWPLRTAGWAVRQDPINLLKSSIQRHLLSSFYCLSRYGVRKQHFRLLILSDLHVVQR
jgi:hypothetical protein